MLESSTWSKLFAGISNHWERRLMLLFISLFLMQFVFWFSKEEYGFLPKTENIIIAALGIVFVIFLPLRIKPWLRYLMQFIVLLTLNAYVVQYQPIGGAIHTWNAFWLIVRLNGQQLFPYLWFIAGAWLCYAATVWWVKTKGRIAILVVGSVISVSIRDSFSIYDLWNQAAMMVFCGLCMLVIYHFAALKRKNPLSWSHIAEYPGALAIPVVLILGVTMFLGTMAPNVSNLLTDPYTLYKSWQGVVVDKIVKPNSPGSPLKSTSNNKSGYSRNDLSLGGGFDFDYSTVMKINASHRSYWRGETRNVYTGKGWAISNADKKAELEKVTDTSKLAADPQLTAANLKTSEVTAQISFEKKSAYPILFGPFAITSVQSLDTVPIGSVNNLRWSPNQSTLYWDSTGSKAAFPTEYSLTASVPIIDEAGLRQSVNMPDELAELKEDLQLPDTLPSRVSELARSLTADANNSYDKVKKIEDYLRTTYPYTNKPDFVDSFLFEIKEGYCDYYSTAMVVLVRSLGIPARWVKGYASGESSQDEARASGGFQGGDNIAIDNDGADVYTVRNSDAHSWAEVYFSGYGWIPFEPTAGFTLPDLSAPQDAAITPPTEVDTAPAFAAVTGGKSFNTITIISISLFVILFAILLWLFKKNVVLKPLRKRIFGNHVMAINTNEQLIHEYTRFLRYSGRKGYIAEEHETVREMVKRWSLDKLWLSNDLNAIIACFEKAKYSGKLITEEELQRTKYIFKRVRKEIS